MKEYGITKHEVNYCLQLDEGWLEPGYMEAEIAFLKSRIADDELLNNSQNLTTLQKAYDDTYLMPIRHGEALIEQKKAIVAAIKAHPKFAERQSYFLFCIHTLNEELHGIEERNKQRKERLQNANFDEFCRAQKEVLEYSISSGKQRLALLEETYKSFGPIPFNEPEQVARDRSDEFEQMLQGVCDDVFASLTKTT